MKPAKLLHLLSRREKVQRIRNQKLDLQQGEMIVVRTKKEIGATLDKRTTFEGVLSCLRCANTVEANSRFRDGLKRHSSKVLVPRMRVPK